jgi:hypothetical protein
VVAAQKAPADFDLAECGIYIYKSCSESQELLLINQVDVSEGRSIEISIY